MNRNQTEFSQYWDKIANTAFYKVVKIAENANFFDKILDNQRDELSRCIKDEISKTFFDSKKRPHATVWLEELRRDYPEKAAKFEKCLRSCEISSKGSENILTIAAGGTAAVTGAAIGKKHSVASALLLLSGVAVAGCKIAAGLSVDTDLLQKEVKAQFESWKLILLKILATCNDIDSSNGENEQ